MKTAFDIAVIGGGAAGCTAAVEAARLGARVALIEQDRLLGGAAWHRGRLPARMLQAAVRARTSNGTAAVTDPATVELSRLLPDLDAHRRKHATTYANALQKHGVMRLHARAVLRSPRVIEVTTVHGTRHRIESNQIVIATGDRPRSPQGARIDYEAVLDMGAVLSAVYLPRTVVVAGDGPSACEMATLLGHLGSQVTLAAPGQGVLPGLDPVLADIVLASLHAAGGTFLPHHTLTGAQKDGQGGALCTLTPTDGSPATHLNPDRVVVATHRTATVRALELGTVGLQLNADGHLPVDRQFRTQQASIRAIGGVIGAGASPTRIRHQARQVAHWALYGRGQADKHPRPFLDTIHAAPELATLGQAENHRPGLVAATVQEANHGLKLVADEHHRLVGLHAWGPGAEKRLQALETAVQEQWHIRRVSRASSPSMAAASKAARQLAASLDHGESNALHPDDLLAGIVSLPGSPSAA
ncbi:MAG: hypothetical protein CL927_15785 [Deltaproteobacteria bacterium]|nr:hypothetical protein [Deltaproteobacteria bacterium]